MKKTLFTTILFVSISALNAQQISKISPEIDGQVESTELKGDTLYFGGNFTRIYPPEISSKNGAQINLTNGSVNGNIPKPNGVINSVISDGVGGWYIGGIFNKVGDSIRNNIAHINALGIVSSQFSNAKGFDGNLNGLQAKVTSLFLNNNKLYVGGKFTNYGYFKQYGALLNNIDSTFSKQFPDPNGIVYTSVPDGLGGWFIGGNFTMVGDSTRTNIAQIDSNGMVTSFNPNANGIIKKIQKVGNDLLVCGSFTSIGGQTKFYLASLNVISGLANTFNGAIGGIVNNFAISGNSIFIGGTFTSIASTSRNRIAALNLTTAALLTWNPNSNNSVNLLEINNGVLYVGGDFTTIGGQTRNKLASLNISTGLATSWNPNPNGTISAISSIANSIYIGGLFTNIGGLSKNNLVCFNSISGNVTSWNPNPNNQVFSIALNGNSVYVGGRFSSIGGRLLNNIALLDSTTGIANSWNPSPESASIIHTISTDANKIYIGGYFKHLGGIDRVNLAVIDVASTNLTSYNPSPNNEVINLSISNNRLYVSGDFDTIGGQARNRFGSLDIITGNATSWNPNPNSAVKTFAFSGSTVFAGGSFSNIGGQPRNYLASLDTISGISTSWNPNPSSNVLSLTIDNSNIYVGGEFTSISGVNRNYLACLNSSTGFATSWNPSPSHWVNTIAISNNVIYIGGSFFSVGGTSNVRKRIAAINSSGSGSLTSWNPNSEGNINSIAIYGNFLYAGGDYSNIGGLSRNNLAAINTKTGVVTSWNPLVNNIISDLAIKDNIVYFGGYFSSVNSITRNKLAAVDAISGVLTNWNPNSNGNIDLLILYDKTIYCSGSFTNIGGIARNYLAAININSGIVTSWNPNPSTGIRTLKIDGGLAYVGGGFSTIGGQTRARIAALDTILGNATSWNPIVNSLVRYIEIKNSTLYICGSFTNIGGQTRNYAGAIDKNTGNVTSWNPNPVFQTINTIKSDGKVIYLGGDFTTFNNQARKFLVAVDTLNGSLFSWNPVGLRGINTLNKNSNTLIGCGDQIIAFIEPVFQFFLLPNTNSSYCAGDSISVSYNYTKNIPAGTIFSVQLSNNVGSFANPLTLGNTSTYNELIKVKIPANLSSGNYQLRILNSISQISENTIGILVNAKPVTSIITGNSNVQINSLHNYSVTNTTGSVYFWSVIGGAQTSGGNTNTIQVTWGNQMTIGNISVVQLATTGCYSDTVYKSLVNVLPVSWLSFEGKVLNENKVILQWKTASEKNNKMFEIESSIDNKLFKKIGYIIGKGNTNIISEYQFLDTNLLSADYIFYRLKQIDFDGKFVYSKTLKINFNNSISSEILVYPNPSSSKLTINGITEQALIYDIFGNIVLKVNADSVVDIYSLTNGVYFLKHKNKATKFIKNSE